MVRTAALLLLLFCFCSAGEAFGQQTTTTFYLNARTVEGVVERVESPVVYFADGRILSLQVVDSVRTADVQLADLLAQQGATQMRVTRRGEALVLDLTRTTWPLSRTEVRTPSVSLLAAGLNARSEALHRLSLTADWQVAKWSPVFFTTFVGAGVQSASEAGETLYYSGAAIGQGVGVAAEAQSVRFSASAFYSFRQSYVSERSASDSAVFLRGALSLRPGDGPVRLQLGADVFLIRKAFINGDDPRVAGFGGIAYVL